jgi:cell wall-associated NlpC family hydrolase
MPAPTLALPRRKLNQPIGRVGTGGTGGGLPSSPLGPDRNVNLRAPDDQARPGQPTPTNSDQQPEPTTIGTINGDLLSPIRTGGMQPNLIGQAQQMQLANALSALQTQAPPPLQFQQLQASMKAQHAAQQTPPARGPFPWVPRAIAAARSLLGTPYVFGGESKTGTDCSGLVYLAFSHAGLHIPRLSANGYMHATTALSRAQLRPGDLLFYHYGRLGAGMADHVNIYIGNGMVISADHPGAPVRIERVDWSHFMRGGRFNGR